MVDNSNSPLFAGRYRFETVSDDWDRGRSGFTHLVYDLKEKRLGVIKRTEISSRQLTAGLKNEVNALKALKGLGVPEVYDTGQAIYGSKAYDYIVIEYIDGIRIEKNLDSLNIIERAEIINKLFGVLSQAHQGGIANGDVDLKHLFWRKDKKQLVVIDWGNAVLGVNPKKKTEFAYDLARAAEIIFSLVTRQGEPAATGSIALPDDLALIDGLEFLPIEFRNLCKWAPRTPSDGAQAPYTAMELFEVSWKWLGSLRNLKELKQKPSQKLIWLSRILVIPFLVIILLTVLQFSNFPLISSISSETPITIISEIPSLTLPKTTVLTETILPTVVSTEAITLTPVVTPQPSIYSPIVIFDKERKLDSCWKNEAILPAEFSLNDGFYLRTDQDWGFRIQDKHSVNDIVQVDFGPCLENKQVGAFALNVAVTRLQPELMSPIKDAREFGFFLEAENDQRREYTLWIDKSKALHLRIWENKNIIYDEVVLVVSSVSLHSADTLPLAFKFPIEIFFEIDNQGFDILYLLEGSLEKSVSFESINPNQMILIKTLPTMGKILKLGLVGHGGPTDTLIWPLVFLEKTSK